MSTYSLISCILILGGLTPPAPSHQVSLGLMDLATFIVQTDQLVIPDSHVRVDVLFPIPCPIDYLDVKAITAFTLVPSFLESAHTQLTKIIVSKSFQDLRNETIQEELKSTISSLNSSVTNLYTQTKMIVAVMNRIEAAFAHLASADPVAKLCESYNPLLARMFDKSLGTPQRMPIVEDPSTYVSRRKRQAYYPQPNNMFLNHNGMIHYGDVNCYPRQHPMAPRVYYPIASSYGVNTRDQNVSKIPSPQYPSSENHHPSTEVPYYPPVGAEAPSNLAKSKASINPSIERKEQLKDLLRNYQQDPTNKIFSSDYLRYRESVDRLMIQTLATSPNAINVDAIFCPNPLTDIGSCKIATIDTPKELREQAQAKFDILEKLIRNQRRSNRRKRGIFNFIGTAYNYLFGVATEDEIESAKAILEQINTRIDTVTDFVAKSNEKVTLALQNIDERFLNLTTHMNEALANVSMSMLALSEATSTLEEQVLTMTNIVTIETHLLQINSAILSNNIFLNILMDRCTMTLTYYIDLINLITTRTMQAGLVNWAKLNQKIKRSFARLKGDMVVPPSLDVNQLYQSTSVSAAIHASTIHTFVDIPLVREGSSQVGWRIHALPYVFTNAIVKLAYPAEILVIDEPMGRHRFLTYDELLNCQDSLSQQCNPSQPWFNMDSDKCLIPALHKQSYEPEKCPVQVMRRERIWNGVSFVKYGLCQWGVSSLHGSLPMTINCPGSVTDQEISTHQIKQVASISLIQGCKAYVGHAYLDCPLIVNKQPTIKLLETHPPGYGNTTLEGPANRLEILDTYTPSVVNTSMLTETLTKVRGMKLKLLTTDNVMTLSDISEAMKNSTTVFMTQDQAVSKSISQQIAQLSASSYKWMELVKDIMTYISFAVSIVVIIYFIYQIQRRNPAMAAGVIGSQLLSSRAGAFAQTIIRGKRLNKRILTDMMNESLITLQDQPVSSQHPLNISSNATLTATSNVTSTVEYLSNYYITQGVTPLTIIMIIMITVHCLVAWYMIRSNKTLSRRILILLGKVPKNMSALHHPGEIGLCGNFLIKFSSRIVKDETIKEIACQICTLPRSASEWYCIIQSEQPTFLIPAIAHRWVKYFDLTLKWGQLCIKSKWDDNIDTCTSLPNSIRVKLADIIAQVDSDIPILWTHIQSMTVTKLYLSGPHYYRELYVYGLPTREVPAPTGDGVNRNKIVKVQQLKDTPAYGGDIM